jgi:hypothetical protein
MRYQRKQDIQRYPKIFDNKMQTQPIVFDKSHIMKKYKDEQNYKMMSDTAKSLRINNPLNQIKKEKNAQLIQNLLNNDSKIFNFNLNRQHN